MTSSMLLLNLIVDGVTLGCIYSLFAIGFSLLWWIAGIVHIAHGATMLAGGFALFAALEMGGAGLTVALLAGLLGAVTLGVIVEIFMYRPLLNRGTDEMGILTASLGALIFFEYVITIVFGPEGATLDAGGLRTPVVQGLPLVFDRFSALIVCVTLATFLALWFLLAKTRIGREMRAIASNLDLAEVLGINIRLVQVYAAAIAAALCLPPAAFLLFNTGLVPSEALHVVLVASVVAILGGRGSLLGALIAGLLIGVAESAMTWRFAAGWRQLITFSLLYALLLVRPQGLFGERV
jgi:branched-chain amino acid transport system permease protein